MTLIDPETKKKHQIWFDSLGMLCKLLVVHVVVTLAIFGGYVAYGFIAAYFKW